MRQYLLPALSFAAIRQYCRDQKLFLIEDAAHAAGASINGLKAGSLCDAGAFSFYPTKPMTTGEGGMITTNDVRIDEFARSVRCHGIATGEDYKKYDQNLLVRLGHNWRMSEIQALLGFYQLKRLDKLIKRRQRIAKRYNEQLNGKTGLTIYKTDNDNKSSFYKFPVKFEARFDGGEIRKRMRNKYGIQCGSIYYPPCHLQPFYKEKFGYKNGDFPIAKSILSQTIALPIHPEISKKDIHRITSALQNCMEKYGNR
jgi:perosamine synthetase